MPSSAEYQDAIKWQEAYVDDARRRVAATHVAPERIDGLSLALRWLRVGAAMEAGTLRLQPPSFWNDEWQANYQLAPAEPFGVGEGPDPLTAAERAMGVGT